MTSSEESQSKEFVVAKDYEQLVTLFYSDIYFLCFETVQDEEVAKALVKKIFELAEEHFDSTNNNFPFVEAIFKKVTSYQKSDESKLEQNKLNETR